MFSLRDDKDNDLQHEPPHPDRGEEKPVHPIDPPPEDKEKEIV